MFFVDRDGATLIEGFEGEKFDQCVGADAFAGALAESGEAVPLLKKISSSTFNAQLNVATQVVNENPHLYYEIQQGNDNTAEVSSQFRKVLNDLITAVADNDEAVFAGYMGAARQRLADDQI